MSPRDFFLVGMWLLALATAPALSVAETTEAKWGIKVNLLPIPTFKSFAEAETEMKLPSTNADAPVGTRWTRNYDRQRRGPCY